MATYTTIADGNGDFTVPFSSNYTGGQKITVTAEKDSAIKTIELFAPSNTTGGGAIQFSGTLDSFPENIGVVTISDEIAGALPNFAFYGYSASTMWGKATGLILPNTITSIGASCFAFWSSLQTLSLPTSLATISDQAFRKCDSLENLTIPASVTALGDSAFLDCSALTEINMLRSTPPTIWSSTFSGISPSCVIKVPIASLTAYQTATNWSAHASKMVGV